MKKQSKKTKKSKHNKTGDFPGAGTLHVFELENSLHDFLSELDIPEKLTVDDIRDIVWNDDDIKLSSRLSMLLLEHTDKKKFQDGLDIIMEAWNHFPHRSLNGLSPREMVERNKTRANDSESNLPLKHRRTFYEVFSGRFPSETRVVRRGKNEWEFEYTAEIQELNNLVYKLDKLDEEINEGDEDTIEMLSRNTSEILAVLEKAVKKQPLFFNGVIRVARDMFSYGEMKRARALMEMSIDAGRALLPVNFKLGKDILIWGMLDNRPFLSLLGDYATFVESVDGSLRSIPLYEELIALNPNDNQGMRGLLATAYLKTNKLEELCLLRSKYPTDLVQELSTGNILALYKLGRHDEARKEIKKTSKYSMHVFKEILKTSHVQPELTPGRLTVGGEDEAWLYWDAQGNMWMTSPGAREFLKEVLSP